MSVASVSSIYTPALTDGQLWIGDTDNPPLAANLTAGTGINITNGAGSITLASTGFGSLTWQVVTTGANPILPFIGYIATNTAAHQYNSSAQVGDIYMMTNGVNGVQFGIMSSVANILFGNTPVSSISSSSNNAALCLVGVGFGQLSVLFATGTFSTG